MAVKKTEYIKFGENLYEIIPPLPSGTDRGGIIASPKESTDTVEIKLGDDGKLYAPAYPDLSNIDTSELQAQIDEHKSDTNVHVTTEEKNKLANMATTSDISTHNTATDAHNDIRALISDLSTEVSNFLDVDDTTRDQLSEVLTLIDNNKGTLDSLTTSKVNVADIVDNLTTASSNKVLSANQGVALKSLIDSLESLVGTKADSSTLSNYYTKSEIDGYELISVSDIDAICGSGIQLASEVMF